MCVFSSVSSNKHYLFNLKDCVQRHNRILILDWSAFITNNCLLANISFQRSCKAQNIHHRETTPPPECFVFSGLSFLRLLFCSGFLLQLSMCVAEEERYLPTWWAPLRWWWVLQPSAGQPDQPPPSSPHLDGEHRHTQSQQSATEDVHRPREKMWNHSERLQGKIVKQGDRRAGSMLGVNASLCSCVI